MRCKAIAQLGRSKCGQQIACGASGAGASSRCGTLCGPQEGSALRNPICADLDDAIDDSRAHHLTHARQRRGGNWTPPDDSRPGIRICRALCHDDQDGSIAGEAERLSFTPLVLGDQS
jgi:hypothetical protein